MIDKHFLRVMITGIIECFVHPDGYLHLSRAKQQALIDTLVESIAKIDDDKQD